MYELYESFALSNALSPERSTIQMFHYPNILPLKYRIVRNIYHTR